MLQARLIQVMAPVLKLARCFFRRNAHDMGDLKTLLSSCLLILLATSQGRSETDLVSAMASCAGRYSAELEHAWLMDDPRSEILSRQRENTLSILEAITTADAARDILNLRIDAKHAHARLLTMASFGTAPSETKWAKRQSRLFLQNCAAMLLDS